jgi:hypothetical protein
MVAVCGTVGLAACDGGPTSPFPEFEVADTTTAPDGKDQTPIPPDSVGPTGTGRILVDASHDGGVWWYPQSELFYPDSAHQGKALASYLRSLGYEVTEVPRGWQITDSLLSSFTTVIRAGEWGVYHQSELEAYENFVSRETTLILLSDHRKTDARDELAEMLGVTVTGVVHGPVTKFADHAITERVEELPYVGGAYVSAYDPEDVEILGWLEGDVPVMGLIKSYKAKVFFMGDTNGIEWVPQPFVDNLLEWGF